MVTDWLKFILATPMPDGRPFSEVAEPWQVEDYEGMIAHLNSCLIRPRGHDKTAGLARFVRAVFILSERRENIFCVAADDEQAGILFADVRQMCEQDPATADLVRTTGRTLELKDPPRSTLRVMAHSPSTIMGIRPTFIVGDEPAEWRGRAMWDALYSATGKVKGCRVAVISVPPVSRVSVLAEIMDLASSDTSGRWHYSHRSQCAGWVDAAWLEDQRRTLPAHVYKRLHEAVQTEGAGAWLSEDEIRDVFAPMPDAQAGLVAVGLDLGVSRDRSFLAVVRLDEATGLFCVLHLVGWVPRPGERVNLEEVEAAARKYQATVYLDPWQGVLLGQRLGARGVDAREFTFSGEGRRKLFGTLLDVIRRRRLRSHPHAELKQELLALEVRESLSGYRVDHKSSGHDDATVAVGLALQGLPHEEGSGEYVVEVGGPRTSALAFETAWENLPSPGEAGVWRGGPSGGGIDWDNVRW